MGLATGRPFAAAGAAVVLADINKAALTSVTNELTAAGHGGAPGGVAECALFNRDGLAAPLTRFGSITPGRSTRADRPGVLRQTRVQAARVAVSITKR